MTLILFMIIFLFCLAVFAGAVVELFMTMNIWGFLFLVLFMGYLVWRFPSFRRNPFKS